MKIGTAAKVTISAIGILVAGFIGFQAVTHQPDVKSPGVTIQQHGNGKHLPKQLSNQRLAVDDNTQDERNEQDEETNIALPLVAEEKLPQEKSPDGVELPPDEVEPEVSQGDEQRDPKDAYDRLLEELKERYKEEWTREANILIEEAWEAAPIADQYVRKMQEFVSQRPPPPGLGETVKALEETKRPYIQKLANAQGFLNDKVRIYVVGEWMVEESEKLFSTLDWWEVGETVER